mmetsp:Transcript_1629/g.3463  ORF Transcript_1629/g.3463 Transcript_1629/m.3463 type:complete len:222 (-) Transcript_1629:1001-1666(-)
MSRVESFARLTSFDQPPWFVRSSLFCTDVSASRTYGGTRRGGRVGVGDGVFFFRSPSFPIPRSGRFCGCGGVSRRRPGRGGSARAGSVGGRWTRVPPVSVVDPGEAAMQGHGVLVLHVGPVAFDGAGGGTVAQLLRDRWGTRGTGVRIAAAEGRGLGLRRAFAALEAREEETAVVIFLDVGAGRYQSLVVVVAGVAARGMMFGYFEAFQRTTGPDEGRTGV